MDSVDFTFQAKEFEQVKRNVEGLPYVMNGAIMSVAYRAGGRVIKKDMERRLDNHVSSGDPVRNSGEPRKHLRDSVQIFRRKWHIGGVRISAAATVVGIYRQPHWIFLEYGTIKQPATPFFKPAVESTLTEQMQAIEKSAISTFNRYMRQMQTGKTPNAIVKAAQYDDI